MSILKNVVVNWASVQDPNIQFEPAWELQAMLTKEQADELVAEAKKVSTKGIKIKKDDNGQLSYRFRRRVERADGKGDNEKPVVYGPTGKAGGDFTEKVGNGSICNIQYLFLAYDNKFGKGVTCDLKGVQVLEHVKYGVSDGDEFNDESGDQPAKQLELSDNSYNEEDFG